MELGELKSMWQAREANLEKSAKLNTQLLDKIESRKIQSILKPLLVENKIVLFLHILFIAGLLIFFVYHINELPYAASALVLLLFYVYLTMNCIHQIKAIRNVDRCTDISWQTNSTGRTEYTYPALPTAFVAQHSCIFLSFPGSSNESVDRSAIELLRWLRHYHAYTGQMVDGRINRVCPFHTCRYLVLQPGEACQYAQTLGKKNNQGCKQ